LLAGLGCTDTGPDISKDCTARNDGEFNLQTPAELFGSTQAIAGLSGNVRSFTWVAPLLGDLCVAAPESGNSVTFQFTYDVQNTPETLTAQGRVITSVILQPYSVAVVRAGIFYHGTVDNIGLAQASSDGKHALVSLELRVSFPTLGSLAADQAAIRSWVTGVTIAWHFQTLTP